MRLSHEVLSESKSARELTISERSNQNALDLLNKAKALVMAVWQGTGRATTEQVAEYYDVPTDTVKSCLRNNKEEFEKEVETLNGEELKELKSTFNLSSNAPSINLWTARGALRVGLMLTKSAVAKNVRDVVLNVVEYAEPPKPQTAIELVQQQLAALTTLVQISVEHEARLSTIEQENIVLKAELAVQAQINAEQETHLKGLDAELARHQNSEGHFYTVIGFANLNNMQMGSNQAKGLGLRCSNYCKKHDIYQEKVSDTMWGQVGSYPVHVLETIFRSQNLI